MTKPKRSSDNYLKLRHTVTNKAILNIVMVISKEKLITPQQVCADFIRTQAAFEIEKRKSNGQ